MPNRTVGDVMVRRLATVPPDATLLQVRDIFAHVRFHHLLVVESRRLVGIISDRDVLRTVSPFFGTVNEQPRDAALMARRVHQIMTRQPICATPAISLADAVRTMYRRKISALPVIAPATGELVGLLTWKDLVRAHMPEAFAAPTQEEAASHDSARGYVRAAVSSLPSGEPATPAAPPAAAHATPPPAAPATGAAPTPATHPHAAVAGTFPPPMNPAETAFQPAPEILAVIAAAAAVDTTKVAPNDAPPARQPEP